MHFSYIPRSSPALGGSYNVSRHEINDGQQQYFSLQNLKTGVFDFLLGFTGENYALYSIDC